MAQLTIAHRLLVGCLATAIVLPAAADYNAGNYRRDMDEANRQRMMNNFRRDAEVTSRRNEELRRSNAYQAPAKGSVSGSKAGDSSGGTSGGTYSPGVDSGPRAIESTTTVTVRVKESEQDTVARILKEAEAGNLESQWNAGRLYYTGGFGGVSRDDAKAAQWFKKAALAGHPEAGLAYGEIIFNAKGSDENPAEAARWFKFAAEKGIPRAMFFWGTLLEVGHGTNQDFAAAFGWIKKAAEQGESNAYASLGSMYAEGRGTPVDFAAAHTWLRKGAENGDGTACIDLGTLYLKGQGVAKDEPTAARWFIKGAEAGNRNGMFNAGLLYEKGMFGVRQDIEKARAWYSKAAAAGMPAAQQALARLGAPGASNNSVAAEAPAAATVNGKYSGLLQTINCPRDQAEYGQFTDYGYWAGGAWCGQTGKSGYWVWVAPSWYVWSQNGGTAGAGNKPSESSVPASASVNGKYTGLVQTINCPRDQAEYGQFTDYGYWSGGAWCGQTGKGGHWVWVAPSWYVWSNKTR
jgi:TPR repeat protein